MSAPLADAAELERRRAPSNDPCGRMCGNCSQCIRSMAAHHNMGRYGQPDYPGADPASPC